MNKKEFLKALERKLSILNETELNDIINEYKDTIEEKVKHGESEEDAVKDFGSIDELTKEILKAYKINPKYGEKKETVKEVVDDCESLIKKGAKGLTNLSKKVVDEFQNSNNNLTIELVFEILIRFIILLFLFALLRLPISLINAIGESILNVSYYPINKILIFIWDIVLFLLYVVLCAMMLIAMFKNYFNNSTLKSTSTKQSNSKKEEIKKEVKPIEEDIEEVKKVEKTKKVKQEKNHSISNSLGKVLKIMLQLFVLIFFLIPLWLLIFISIIGIIFSFYYLLLGLPVFGILTISIGVFILFVYFSDIFRGIVFETKKVHFFSLLLSLFIIAIGFVITINECSSIEYIKIIPENNFSIKTIEQEAIIDRKTYINGDIEYQINNEIEDNKLKIEITYYDELSNVTYENYNRTNNTNIINIYPSYEGTKNIWKLYNLIINNLSERKLYDYQLFYKYQIKVTCNEKTMDLIDKG